jgi:hypothetical protein
MDPHDILTEALPGATLRDVAPLGHGQLLTLGDERKVVLRTGAVAAEGAALALLAGEIDLPLPELLGRGEHPTAGPWLLRSYIEGAALPAVIAALGEEARYDLGRRLGETLHRIHRLRTGRYGALADDDPLASSDDLAYTVRRAEAAIARAEAVGALPDELSGSLRDWFGQQVAATNRAPALVHGGLRPEHIIVRPRAGRTVLAGIVGWSAAQGWSPGWDHTNLLETMGGQPFFSLRVGYGERYDDATELAHEQVREYALLPYRMILHLEALPNADATTRDSLARLLAALLALSGRNAGGANAALSA